MSMSEASKAMDEILSALSPSFKERASGHRDGLSSV